MARSFVVGMFADELGHRDRVGDPHRFLAAPAREYRSVQSAVPLDWSHGDRIGQVTALGEDPQGRAWAVAELNSWETLPERDLWFSPQMEGRLDGSMLTDIELRGLAVTPCPASVGLQPVEVLDAGTQKCSGFRRELLERGRRSCRRGDVLRIEERFAGADEWYSWPRPRVVGDPGTLRRVPPREGPPVSGSYARVVDGKLGTIWHSASYGRVVSVR